MRVFYLLCIAPNLNRNLAIAEMRCAGCLKNTTESSGILCSVENCRKTFCALCIDASRLTPEGKKKWVCPDCCAILRSKNSGGNSLTPVRGSTDSQNITVRKKHSHNPESVDLKELTAEIRFLREDITLLRARLEETTVSLTRCHERLDDLGITLSNQETRIKHLETCETENVVLKAKVVLLQNDINIQAQNQLRNEIELSGVPETPNESLLHTVLVAARKLGVELEETDIDWANRVGPRRPPSEILETKRTLPRPLVVRLLRRAKRDELLKAAKSRRNVTSVDLDIPGPALRVFFNERLTKENRALFRDARIKCKEYGFAQCFCSHGAIFVRKRDGKPATLVRGFADLVSIAPEVTQ